MTKIYEWFTRGPKIIGEVEQIITATESNQGVNKGALVLLLMYLVNKRISPTTIRGSKVFAKLRGEWVEGHVVAINDGFNIPNYAINFSSARLYERIGQNLLEYGKGVRGWMRFSFPGETSETMKGTQLKVVFLDALGGTHKIFYTIPDKKGEDKLHYFPGSGMSQN